MKISKIKKVLAIALVVILCVLSTTATVSAKLSQPTNTIKTNGNGGKTDIGMWYVTYNTSSQFVSNFGTGYPIKYRMLMPDGSYGILDSGDTAHIDFQLKELAEAKVDFVLFDLTNGGLTSKVPFGWKGDENGNPTDRIITDAQLACERIAKWRFTIFIYLTFLSKNVIIKSIKRVNLHKLLSGFSFIQVYSTLWLFRLFKFYFSF